MTTTAIIIEMVVIGYTSFIWMLLLALFLFNFFGIAIPDITSFYKNENRELFGFLIVPITALAYQAGWLIDNFSYNFFYTTLLIGKLQKRKYVDDGKWWTVYNRILISEKDSLNENLKQDLSVIKFTRAGVLNFFLIGIFICPALVNQRGYFPIVISIFCAIIAIACHLTSIKKSRHWYSKIVQAYETIKDLKEPHAVDKPQGNDSKSEHDKLIAKSKRNMRLSKITIILLYALSIGSYIIFKK
jgi:hypothetical protein